MRFLEGVWKRFRGLNYEPQSRFDMIMNAAAARITRAIAIGMTASIPLY